MWFFGLVVVVLVGAVAVVASGRWGQMSTAYDDRPDVSIPARQVLSSDDIAATRFGVGLRGYRMDEVDVLLERLAREVAERDRRIADLERAVTPILHGPEGAGFTSRAEYDDDTDFDDTGYQKPILVGGEFPPAAAPEAATELTPQPATDAAGQTSTDAAGQSPPQPATDAAGQTPADAAEQPSTRSVPPAEEAVPVPPAEDSALTGPPPAEARPAPEVEVQPAEQQPPADAQEAAAEARPSGQEFGEDGDQAAQPRGRHSAAPDPTFVQRPRQ